MSLRVAGPVARARAWLIDFGIRVAIYMTAAQFLVYFQKVGTGAMFVLVFALEWLYPTVFEVMWRGATPGKRVCRLSVLRDDGSPVDWGASFIRNTLRAVDFLPLLYGFGLVSMMLTRDYRRLGDLAAGTVVVYVDEPARAPLDAAGDAEPPPVSLSAPEQRAVIDYLLRSPRLTPERAQELAGLAQPLTAGLTGPQAGERLARIGRFLLGRR